MLCSEVFEVTGETLQNLAMRHLCVKKPQIKKNKKICSFFQLKSQLCAKLNLPSPRLIPLAPPGFSMHPTMKVKSNPIQLEENEWLIYNKWALNNNKPTREQ